MKRSSNMKTTIKPVAAAIALALAASPASALTTFFLAAKQYTKYLPDGTEVGFPVTMWGYVEDTGDGITARCFQVGSSGGANNATNRGLRQGCIDALPDPGTEPLRLVVPPGETDVRILLSNGLPEPTSIVIPGQELPWSANNNGPTFVRPDETTRIGSRNAPDLRVRSFGREAAADGGRLSYRWEVARDTDFDGPGTFLFHSGTHPQKQVYMGLAGLITQDHLAGEAYPGVPYNNEATLFYSDIDPAFNEAVVANTLDTAIERQPAWFLVNGEPYEANVTAGIDAGAVGENVLLRLASTATDTHVAVLQGLNMTLHAEDGQQYNYQEGGTSTPAPRVQYSAMLPPAKTKDAIVVAPLQGDYAVYDGNGYMTNPSDPADEAVGDTIGGMLRFLAFAGGGTNQAPTASADMATVVEGFSTNINALGNDTDPEGDPLSIHSFDTTGTLGAAACTTGVVADACSYDASGVPAGTVDTFTYIATDGPNVSDPATVTVTVTANQVPTANNDTATTNQDVAVVIDVVTNDTDPEGQPLTVANFDATSTGGQTVSCASTDCTYTPSGPFSSAGDTFTYTVTDGVNESVAATVTVAVVAPNLPPTANDDPTTPGDPAFSTGINTQLTGIDVLGNDMDMDGPSALTIVSFDATGTATFGEPPESGSVACVTGVATGTCTYTPPTGYVGTDNFTYTVTDGVDTATATVTVTVNDAAAIPALYFSTSGNGSVPGVAGPYDDGDVYTVDAGDVYSRLYDAIDDLGLPNGANIDGMSIDGSNIYVSFASSSTSVPGPSGNFNVNDEDVVVWDGTSWSLFFEGSVCGLSGSSSGDIDAVSVVGTTLYFSTLRNITPTGVTGPGGDDADIYTWVQGGTSCSRALDGSAAGLNGEDIDALTVQGAPGSEEYYISTDSAFNGADDEAVHVYNGGGSWSLYRSNSPGLSGSGAQDVDAIHVP